MVYRERLRRGRARHPGAMAASGMMHLEMHDSACSAEIGLSELDLKAEAAADDGQQAAAAQDRRGANGGFHLPPLRLRDMATADGWRRLCSEGHTVADAALTVASAQIGQIMLVWPHQMWQTGIAAGLAWQVCGTVWNIWTMFILICLYLERKTFMIRMGTWWEKDGLRRTVSQFHEVMGWTGHQLGGRSFGIFVQIASQVLIGLSLFGTCIAQVIAASGNLYSIDTSHSKRAYALYVGGAMVAFSFVPSFRHFRLLNIVSVFGTTFAAIYIFTTAVVHGTNPGAAQWAPVSMQDFFLGASTLALGGHSNALEIMDVMQKPHRFDVAYSAGFLYAYLGLTIPHSVAVNLAYPTEIGMNDNVYGLLPINTAKRISVWLMIIHQFITWALFVTPLLYMWEKAIRTHTKPYWIRLPSRLPIALLIWFIAVLLPFYSLVNSFFASLIGPFIGFVIPCGLYNWYYSSEENRRSCPMKPPGILAKWGWKPVFAFNIFMVVVNVVAFTGFGIFYNVKSIIANADTLGVFPRCYQCEA